MQKIADVITFHVDVANVFLHVPNVLAAALGLQSQVTDVTDPLRQRLCELFLWNRQHERKKT